VPASSGRIGVIYVACLAFAALFATQVKAEDPETTADLRCVIATSESQSLVADQVTKNGLQSTMLYYLGRLDGRDPSFDLRARYTEEAAKMTRQDIGLEDKRCGQELSARGQALSSQIGAVRPAPQ